MMECTSNRSATARTSDAVSGNDALRLIVPPLTVTPIRTQKTATPKGPIALPNALSSIERPTPTGQCSPENSSSVTLSP